MSKYTRKCDGVDPAKGNCWQIYADEARFIADRLPDKEARWRVIGMAFDRWLGLTDETPTDAQELALLMMREMNQMRHAGDFFAKCERGKLNRAGRQHEAVQPLPQMPAPRRRHPQPAQQLPPLPQPQPGEYDGDF